jgi:hypothetical protein
VNVGQNSNAHGLGVEARASRRENCGTAVGGRESEGEVKYYVNLRVSRPERAGNG